MPADTRQILANLLKECTDAQRRFLLARQYTTTDEEAAKKAGLSPRSVTRWKKESPFREVYPRLLEAKPEGDEEGESTVLVVDPADVQQAARAQLKVFAFRLPRVFSRLFDIAETGKDTDSLKAIGIIGEWFGISPEALRPQIRTLVQQQILSWTVQGEKSESPDSNHREVPVEASFREVPTDE